MIPPELKKLPQWVCWRLVKRGDDKPTKIPFAVDGSPAKSDDPATWTTFDLARQAPGFDGVGFVFSDSDPYVGIDLDNSINGDGKLKPWGQKLVDRFNTYTEISPSGKGVKLWVRARYSGDGTGKRRPYQDGAVEMYHARRFFTVTGQVYPGTNPQITEQQTGVDGLYDFILKPKLRPRSAPDVIDRCKKYIDKCPSAISGQGGHDRTFCAACICFRFGLSEAQAWEVMQEFNAKCSPPWSDKELQHKINDARTEVERSGEFDKFNQKTEHFQPRTEIVQPPQESSVLLKRLSETIDGARQNVSWPWPVLTMMARALLPGAITVLSGQGGASKSLFISEACLHWLAQGIPFAVFHLEEDREFHEIRALAQLSNQSGVTDDRWVMDNPDVTLDAYSRAVDSINELGRRIWDAPDADVSLDDLERWIQERCDEGFRVLVIDPVTAADSGREPWRADRKFVINAKRILRNSGASLVVVTHPRDGNPKTGNRLDNHAGGQAYNRFTSCVLNLSAHQPPKFVTTLEYASVGTLRTEAQINRSISIHKARSGKGAGWDIGYTFDHNTLRFQEKGLVAHD